MKTILPLLCVCFITVFVSADTITVYPVPDGIASNEDFSVQVRAFDGSWQKLFCYDVQVDMHNPRQASMAYFDFSGSVDVSVIYNRGEIKSARIRPLSYGIEPTVIDAVQSYLSKQVWAMIQLQLYTGARPGEIVELRACDIDRSRDVWVYRPEHHKNEYRDQEREIYIGSNVKDILAPFLFGKRDNEYLFSPKDANRETKQRDAARQRRADQKPSPRKTSRTIGDKYTVDSYRRAIYRACEKAGIAKWSPHRLRHNAATVVREKYGIEAAQLILGHSRADVTQIYAERNKAMAYDIAAKIG